MKRLSAEFKVGIFVLIVIFVLALMTFKVGFFDWFKKEGYVVYATFWDIAGLDKNTKIKIAGVNAGAIEEISLEEGKARLTLRIEPDIVLYSDAVASINSTGLLGDKYLALRVGSEGPVLRNGDTIKNTQEVFNIDDAVRKLSTISDSITRLTDNLNDVFGTEESKEALKTALKNLKTITQKIDVAITENDSRLRTTLDNVNRLAKSLQEVVNENSEPLKETLVNMKDFTSTLRTEGPQLVKNIKETTDSLKNISGQIEHGEGTLGKLVKDDKLYTSLNTAATSLNNTLSAVDRFRTYLTFQGDWLTRIGEGKGYFYLTLQPKPDKYYILGIVGDPLGSVTTTTTQTTTNGVTTFQDQVKTRRKIEFSAEFGKRFNNTVLRAGLIENTLGVGVDQFFLSDRLKVTSDVWDIKGDREEGSDNPHVTIGADFFLYKSLFLRGGYDNIFNSEWAGLYFGAGVRFEDEDIKYLLGTLSRVPAQ